MSVTRKHYPTHETDSRVGFDPQPRATTGQEELPRSHHSFFKILKAVMQTAPPATCDKHYDLYCVLVRRIERATSAQHMCTTLSQLPPSSFVDSESGRTLSYWARARRVLDLERQRQDAKTRAQTKRQKQASQRPHGPRTPRDVATDD